MANSARPGRASGAEGEDALEAEQRAKTATNVTDEDMTSMRGSAGFREIGSAGYCVKGAAATIKNSNATYKNTVGMMGPTVQLLMESRCRANRALARLEALPCQTVDQDIGRTSGH